MTSAPRIVQRKRALLVAGVFGALTALAFPCRADATPDAAAAEQLFAEGRALMAAKKYDLACPKLEASERLDPGAGTLLNLAGCYEAAGRTASAWATYREVEGAAARSNRADWAHTAHERALILAPGLSYLTITVPSASRVPGLVVERDGRAVDAALFGEAVPTDPGPHDVTASAPGKQRWTARVVVRAGGARGDVTVPSLVLASSGPASSGDAASAAEPSHAQATWGIVAMAAGGAALVGGGVFGLLARSTYDDAVTNECRGNVKTCSPRGVERIDTANTRATLSTVLVVTGGALGAAGVLLFVLAPRDGARRVGVGLAPGLTQASLVARGTF